MPAGRDVLFPALLVERDDEVCVNRREVGGTVDDPRVWTANDVVYVRLVEGPRVHQPLHAIFLVVYRTDVETVDLGGAVVVASEQPRAFRGVEPRRRRVVDEPVYGLVERLGARQTPGVHRVRAVGVVSYDILLEGVVCSSSAAGGHEARPTTVKRKERVTSLRISQPPSVLANAAILQC